ncbi:hypothetical protein [Pedobacter suwonensis]|uniref:Uncharacterized protein n=1 Tax=Pedobacter suwonensis TaxID=332999 RepID=A0A1I0SUE0_9SPHI|nr:hypothetical protein [Pedobacter suwonensis]SFA43109.1 hypothetical protein SAMN04488511_103256 [Pedobacter suwonensis]
MKNQIKVSLPQIEVKQIQILNRSTSAKTMVLNQRGSYFPTETLVTTLTGI